MRREPFWRSRRRVGRAAGRRSVGSPVERAEAAEALFHAGRDKEATVAFGAVIGELQLLRGRRPNDPELDAQIAGQLNNLGRCLIRLGRYHESVDALDRSATIFAGLRDRDGTRWTPDLAGTVESLSRALGHIGRWPAALAESGRAVELRREASPGGQHDLAVALRSFAHIRVDADADIDSAMEAVTEALALHMGELQREPMPGHVQHIYASELVHSQLLARSGQPEAAERVARLVRSGHLDDLLDLLLTQRDLGR